MEFGALILIGGFLILLFLRVPIAFCMGSPLLPISSTVECPSRSCPASGGWIEQLSTPCGSALYLCRQMMNSATMSLRIFDFCAALSGHIRGGLAHVNILNSMIFAGVSGTAVADAASIGGLEMKIMREQGYDPASVQRYGRIVHDRSHYPPSVVMIIYGVMAEVSIGRLFMGGLGPES